MSKDSIGGVAPRRDLAANPPPSSSSSLFSKASATFSRTPSKKHRLASPPVPYLQRPFSRSSEKDLDSLPSDPFRPPSRPGYLRSQTTPIDATGNPLSPKSNPLTITTSAGGGDERSPTSDNMINTRNGLKSATGTYASIDMTSVGLTGGLPVATPLSANAPNGPQNPNILYQHIHDMASKRISTLDYLRKAHEGRVYWFNTVHFSKSDLARLPSLQQAKLTRRATNYMLLGLSIPTILDVYASSPYEFLRALNTLLGEFESFQQLHPSDGSSGSTLSRARIPQMFKRSNYSTKGRRSSSANEIGLPMQSNFNNSTTDTSSIATSAISETFSGVPSSMSSVSSTSTASIPSSFFDPSLGTEEYTHLLTPALPFDPDFFETFATLCDVLIDAYTRVIAMVATPSVCTPALGDVFAKADARLRKVIVGGIVREFEETSRATARAEFAGVSRVVLGGLVG